METPTPNLVAPAPPEHTTVIHSDQQIASVTFVEEDGRWFKVLNSVIDSGEWASLSDAARNVLIVLARHANSEGSSSPSLASLMHCSGLSRPGVYKALKELSAGSKLIARSEVTKAYGLFPGRPFASRKRSANPEKAPAPVSTPVDHLHEQRRKLSTPVDGVSTRVDKLSTPVDPLLIQEKREEDEDVGGIARRVASVESDDDGRGDAARRLVSEARMADSEARNFIDRFGPQRCIDALENALYRKRSGTLKGTLKGYCWTSAREGYGLFTEVQQERQNAEFDRCARLLSETLNLHLTREWKDWVRQVFTTSRNVLKCGAVTTDEVRRLPPEELARRVMDAARACAGNKPSEYRRVIEAARREGAIA